MKNTDYLKQIISDNFVQHQAFIKEQEKSRKGLDEEDLIMNRLKEPRLEGKENENASANLNSFELSLIESFLKAFYYSRETNTLDLNEMAVENVGKEELANFLVQPLKRVITFANLIPDFKMLSIQDQVNIVSESAFALIICSSALMFDPNENEFKNSESSFKFDRFKSIWGTEIFEKTLQFLKSIIELKLDDKILIIYLSILLFSTNRNGLLDANKVVQIRSKYTILLKKQIVMKYGENEMSVELFDKLIGKIDYFSALKEMHLSFLKDVNQSKLNPLVKMFIGY